MKRGPNKQLNNIMLRYKTDRIWFSRFLRHRPGNGAGLFLQPWNPHADYVTLR